MAHIGSCFCGAVKVEVTGSPEASGLLSLQFLPFVVCRTGECLQPMEGGRCAGLPRAPSTSRRSKDQVQPAPVLQKCGGHLMNNHPTIGLVDVYAATIPTLKFVPGVHVNYSETVLRMRDGLPKLKDFPAELGGSGVAVPE